MTETNPSGTYTVTILATERKGLIIFKRNFFYRYILFKDMPLRLQSMIQNFLSKPISKIEIHVFI